MRRWDRTLVDGGVRVRGDEVLVGVRAYDVGTGRIVELEQKDCDFRYRSSVFNTTAKGRFVVLNVAYALTTNGVPCI